MAISGPAVAAATVGGFLVYTGIRNVDVVAGLREILGGKVPTEGPQKATASFGNAGSAAASAAGAIGSAAAGGALVQSARAKLGAKYVWAAVGPKTFDCSGLVIACLRDTGHKNVPRFTTHTFALWARSKGWTKVGEKNIQSGDVVLKSGHMGIAISNSEMIHAPHAGSHVKVGKIYTPRYMWSGWRMPGIGASVGSAVGAVKGLNP
jgi:cell wall-associated NlpC family hydrolase